MQSDDKQPTLLMRDRDSLYRPDFDQTFRNAGIRVKKNSFCSPNLQAHIERYIHSMQQECLDHFIVCGEKHFDFLISEYVDYYHSERPHQSLGNEPLTGENPEPAEQPPSESEIICRQRLGVLIKHYERRAA